jgi:hypothetical protein
MSQDFSLTLLPMAELKRKQAMQLASTALHLPFVDDFHVDVFAVAHPSARS